MFLSSLLRNGYAGKIYPINPKESEIMSLKSYSSVLDVPGELDLAVIAISAQGVPQAMAQCSQKRSKFAIVHSVGFSELGPDGKELEERMLKAARSGGVRVVGPNCMGIVSPQFRINTIAPHSSLCPEPGGVAFIGQSGWASENFLLIGHERGLRFSGVISIGNQSDLTIEDFLEYFGTDPETKVIAAYIEGLKQGKRFLELAAEISPRKPIVVWKGGSSELGGRAAASHTGSLAGNHAVFEAASRQKGIIHAQSLDELLDLAVTFACPYLPAGNNVGLLLEAGGGAVASADACTKDGLSIPPLTQEAQQKLHDFLKGKTPPSPSLGNPVDLVWAPFAEAPFVYATCLEIMFREVDSCLIMCYTSLHDEWFMSRLQSICDQIKKPLMVVPGHATEQREGMSLLVGRGIPTFTMPESAMKAISTLTQRSKYLKTWLRCTQSAPGRSTKQGQRGSPPPRPPVSRGA